MIESEFEKRRLKNIEIQQNQRNPNQKYEQINQSYSLGSAIVNAKKVYPIDSHPHNQSIGCYELPVEQDQSLSCQPGQQQQQEHNLSTFYQHYLSDVSTDQTANNISANINYQAKQYTQRMKVTTQVFTSEQQRDENHSMLKQVVSNDSARDMQPKPEMRFQNDRQLQHQLQQRIGAAASTTVNHPLAEKKDGNDEGDCDSVMSSSSSCLNNNFTFQSLIRNEVTFFDDHRIPFEQLKNKYAFTIEGYSDEAARQKLTINPSNEKTHSNNQLSADACTKKQESNRNTQRVQMYSGLMVVFPAVTLIAAAIFFVSIGFYHEDISNILLPILLILIAGAAGYNHSCNQDSYLLKSTHTALPESARVLRNGVHANIPTSNVVEGDILVLQAGDSVPVDCRIIELIANSSNSSVTDSCEIDISLISSSNNVTRIASIQCTNAQDFTLSANIALQGMVVVKGSAKAVALRRRINSSLSKLRLLAESSDAEKKLPIREELKEFVTQSAWVALSIGMIFVLILHTAFELSPIESFMYAAAAMIAVLPKGLLELVAIAKKVVAWKVCKNQTQNGFTVNTAAKTLEQLAGITSICVSTDALVSQHVNSEGVPVAALNSFWVNRTHIDVRNKFNSNEVKPENLIEKVSTSMQLCSLFTSANHLEGGNDVDAALLEFFQSDPNVKLGVSSKFQLVSQKSNSRVEVQGEQGSSTTMSAPARIVFDGGLGISLAVVERIGSQENERTKEIDVAGKMNGSQKQQQQQQQIDVSGDCYTIYIKGKPKRIWELCSSIDVGGTSQAMSKSINEDYSRAMEQYRLNGDKIIAFAKLDVPMYNPEKKNKLVHVFNKHGALKVSLQNLTFIGLATFSNVVTNEAKKTVAIAKAAGINVVLVSRQSAHVVASISKQLGLFSTAGAAAAGKGQAGAAVLTRQNKLKENRQILMDKHHSETEFRAAAGVILSGKRVNVMNSNSGDLIDEQSLIEDLLLHHWSGRSSVAIARADGSSEAKIVELLSQNSERVAVISSHLNSFAGASVSVALPSAKNLVKKFADLVLLDSQASSSSVDKQMNRKANNGLKSVLNAIEVSRSYVETVKKIFVFSGVTQMACVIPVFALLILRMPLFISPMFMVLLSTVMSVIPAVVLALEQPEIDVLFLNKPVQAKQRQKVVTNFKVIVFAYFFIGCVAAAAGFSACYTTMNSLGLPIKSVFGLMKIEGFYPDFGESMRLGYDEDVVNDYLDEVSVSASPNTAVGTVIKPNMPDWNSLIMKAANGNCSVQIDGFGLELQRIDWFDLERSKIDLRKILVTCDASTGEWKTGLRWTYCDPSSSLNHSNPIGTGACYKADVLNYGQTAYFLAIVVFQMVNLVAIKSLRRSLVVASLSPLVVLAAYFLQIAISVAIVEIPEVQKIFRARPIDFWQWGIPAVPFACAALLQEEIRKAYLSFYPWFKKIASI